MDKGTRPEGTESGPGGLGTWSRGAVGLDQEEENGLGARLCANLDS